MGIMGSSVLHRDNMSGMHGVDRRNRRLIETIALLAFSISHSSTRCTYRRLFPLPECCANVELSGTDVATDGSRWRSWHLTLDTGHVSLLLTPPQSKGCEAHPHRRYLFFPFVSRLRSEKTLVERWTRHSIPKTQCHFGGVEGSG